ncbi:MULTISPECIES: hypothetical protein [unclassified Aureimonas]|uniref:hypothetical protein n=1 Tax=Aureimonas sp. Leaf460 TaxID=1736384 RepID=UPI0009EBB68A|nr:MULTISPECIES: hypothetical protein [unclassified Aureimonas]
MSFSKVLILCVAATLTGCASISYPLPKCDGAAKRPLNRSMWQWQEERAGVSRQAAQTAETAPGVAVAPLHYAAIVPTPAADHPALTTFDEAGSRRACRAG